MTDGGEPTIERAQEIVAEYVRRYCLPLWVEPEDCEGEVIEALLLLHRNQPDATPGLEWMRGRDRIRKFLDREARNRGEVIGATT